MPPESCIFCTDAEGEVATVMLIACKSWQYSPLFNTFAVEMYFHDCP